MTFVLLGTTARLDLHFPWRVPLARTSRLLELAREVLASSALQGEHAMLSDSIQREWAALLGTIASKAPLILECCVLLDRSAQRDPQCPCHVLQAHSALQMAAFNVIPAQLGTSVAGTPPNWWNVQLDATAKRELSLALHRCVRPERSPTRQDCAK